MELGIVMEAGLGGASLPDLFRAGAAEFIGTMLFLFFGETNLHDCNTSVVLNVMYCSRVQHSSR